MLFSVPHLTRSQALVQPDGGLGASNVSVLYTGHDKNPGLRSKKSGMLSHNLNKLFEHSYQVYVGLIKVCWVPMFVDFMG